MKLSGMAGTGSGKLGSQVYASVAGTQVVRNYQPIVSNPNTSKQVNQRARLKLMSQLSAVFGPILTYKRQKLTSARNQFVSRNFDLTSGNDGQAQITLENIQITSGTAGLPGIKATRRNGGFVDVELVRNSSAIVDRVVYVMFKKTGEAKLQLIGSRVASDPGEAGVFPQFFMSTGVDVVIYAYGMRDLNSKASAKYGNYNVESGEDVATLFMSRSLSYNDYRFTKTRGTTLLADEETSQSVMPGQSRVFLTPSGQGTLTGAGIYNNGDTVTITAAPAEGYNFVGWRQNGGSQFVAYSQTVKFAASGIIDLIAVFENPESSTGGLDGGSDVNPLPALPEEVMIDSETFPVGLGDVILNTTFDNIGVNCDAEDVVITYVPEGSTLGADDNVTFQQNVQPDYDWGFAVSNTGSGAIYVNGNVWFYITVDDRPQPPQSATIVYINGSDETEMSITNGEIQSGFVPESIFFENAEAEEGAIVFVPNGSTLGAADNVTASVAGSNNWEFAPPQEANKFYNGKVYYGTVVWFTCKDAE